MLYTGLTEADPQLVVAQHLWLILGHELPGAVIVDRSAPAVGPVDEVHMSSTARQLLDNLDRTRGSARRTLTDEEVEQWVDQLIRERGEVGINRLRDQARELAPVLGRAPSMARLDAIVRAALNTGDVTAVSTPTLLSRATGQPIDTNRLAAFQALATQLESQAPDVIVDLPADRARRNLLPFYEAYFSNFAASTSVPR